MQIIKIKLKEGKVECLRYKDDRGDLIELASAETPLPSLSSSMQALAPDFVELAELPEYVILQLKILSVTFSYGDDGTRVTITALRSLKSKMAMCMNTPCTPYYSEHGTALGDITIGKLETVQFEACKFATGERAQGELDLDATEAEAQDAKGEEFGAAFDEVSEGFQGIASAQVNGEVAGQTIAVDFGPKEFAVLKTAAKNLRRGTR